MTEKEELLVIPGHIPLSDRDNLPQETFFQQPRDTLLEVEILVKVRKQNSSEQTLVVG